MSHYDCDDCGRYAGACSCGENAFKARQAKLARQAASRKVTWHVVTRWGRACVSDACHEADAVAKAKALWGDDIIRLTKTVTETFWEAS